MSTRVEITVTHGDPDVDGSRSVIEVEDQQQIEAVLTAATMLLVPYGKLLRTRKAALNHLLDRLLDVTEEPEQVGLGAVKISGRHTP